MDVFTTTVLFAATVLAAVTMGMVQVIKTIGKVPANYIPAVAAVVGILLGLISFPFTDLDVYSRGWAGLIAGLASTGLYEFTQDRRNRAK
ncbi:Holin [Exiguobacterium sp. 8H]|uniref:holin n=1 Tax=unclassified Exiguobacterium TaxID=2644629 RepID=UPI0012F2F0D5|nr:MULTISPECIES: holin [unclassified Exiguobacterium]VXB50813.1 Holin [Exiguobacterium sp. 8A]VXB51890.1 Holin [Exiguobacterium sp. 8H]